MADFQTGGEAEVRFVRESEYQHHAGGKPAPGWMWGREGVNVGQWERVASISVGEPGSMKGSTPIPSGRLTMVSGSHRKRRLFRYCWSR